MLLVNKVDLVSVVSEQFGLSKKQAEDIITFVLDTCFEKAKEIGKVRYGNHRFERVDRNARTGRNPKTGEIINIPARIKITYRNTTL